ncbi:hypothetical protein CL634_10810 [bacterium]|nr:hypothetical protein [bacterium]|tara:strand:- start:2169 stop:2573 length:405 start_codon:yes stop_codon:yes gene_type:complete
MAIFQNYAVGLHNVGSYMVSGIPYITGSTGLAASAEDKIEFPSVARSVTVMNHSSDPIRVHFNSVDDGAVVSGLHFVELDSDEDSIMMSVKCKEIYISAPAGGSVREYRVIAELTQIGVGSMYVLTGSGLTDAA